MSCTLDRCGYLPLVLCAVAADPAGNNFSAFGNEAAQPGCVFIVDRFDFVSAEYADFSSRSSVLINRCWHFETSFLIIFHLAFALFRMEDHLHSRHHREQSLRYPKNPEWERRAAAALRAAAPAVQTDRFPLLLLGRWSEPNR